MPRRHTSLLVAALLLAALAPDSYADDNAGDAATVPRPSGFAAASQRGAAWAVGIYAFVPDDEDPRVAAGFLIDDKGHIATAVHVLDQAQQILVELPDGRLLASPRVHPFFVHHGQRPVGDWVMAMDARIVVQRAGQEPLLRLE